MGESLISLFDKLVIEDILLESTVVTGFEFIAMKECENKCNPCSREKSKGRIFFSIPPASYNLALALRSVDNINLVIYATLLKFGGDKDNDLQLIQGLVDLVDWKRSLEKWAFLKPYKGTMFLSEDAEPENIIKFRVTCNRTGKHSFGSPDAACALGGTLNDKFKWKVDLSNYDLEVILNIVDDDAYIVLKLTDESLHRRNITHFSNVTLRSTICYSLLSLADPKDGDIIVDPLCGSGSIPIEGTIGFPKTFCFGGDQQVIMVEKSKKNIDILPRNKSAQGVVANEEKNEGENKLSDATKSSVAKTCPKTDVLIWKAQRLPLRDSVADIYVTDLPFGKRSGNKSNNQYLYKNIIYEAARVVKPGTGRASFLTADRKSFITATKYNPYWKQVHQITVNQGGIRACAFLLMRTLKAYTPKA